MKHETHLFKLKAIIQALYTLCKNGCLYIILLFIFKLASLTSFLRQKFKEFVIPNEVSEAILNTNKRII